MSGFIGLIVHEGIQTSEWKRKEARTYFGFGGEAETSRIFERFLRNSRFFVTAAFCHRLSTSLCLERTLYLRDTLSVV